MFVTIISPFCFLSLILFVAATDSLWRTRFLWKKEDASEHSTRSSWSQTRVRWLNRVPSGQRKARRPPRSVHMWYTCKADFHTS